MESNQMQSAPKTNGKAITALVLGILSLVAPYFGIILGIIAIIMGKQAMSEVRKTGETGHGMALTGLICGIVSVAIYGLMFIFLIIGISIFSSFFTFF